MKKMILILIVLLVASLTVACSDNEYIKEKDIIKPDYISQSEANVASSPTKQVSKTINFPIYVLDKNVSKVKYLPIDVDLSIDDKVNVIAGTMSAICFNDLPIDVNVDGKKANVNLRESNESRKTWKDDFLDEDNFEETTTLIVKNLLQEDYEGEWINIVHLSYEGEDIE